MNITYLIQNTKSGDEWHALTFVSSNQPYFDENFNWRYTTFKESAYEIATTFRYILILLKNSK